MKNITVSLDDETYRKARIRAAELDTSVSTVQKFLTEFAAGESRFERLAHGCRELYSEDMQHGLTIDGLSLIHPFLWRMRSQNSASAAPEQSEQPPLASGAAATSERCSRSIFAIPDRRLRHMRDRPRRDAWMFCDPG